MAEGDFILFLPSLFAVSLNRLRKLKTPREKPLLWQYLSHRFLA